MLPKIKIHAFKVNRLSGPTAFEDQLATVTGHPIKNRNRETEQATIRLEHAEHAKGLWFADFLKIRTDHGPAKASMNRPVEGFDLKKDEGFGEETALVYHPGSQIALIQYNHYGPRPDAIAQYLSVYDHDLPVTFSLLPRYVDDVQRRLLSKKILRRFTMSIAPRFLNKGDLAHRVALADALNLSDQYDADTVEITISVEGRKRNASLTSKVIDLATWALERATNTAEEISPVKAAELVGKDGNFGVAETLDLVAQRITDHQDVTRGADKRFTRNSRWEGLEKSWKKLHRQLRTDESHD